MRRMYLLSITLVVAFFLLFFMGMKLLSKHIYNRIDCERFNIDHIELRTGLNIPSVEVTECDIKENIKTSNFLLNLEDAKLHQYAEENLFINLDQIYIAQGDNARTAWHATLNPTTRMLKVTLIYKD